MYYYACHVLQYHYKFITYDTYIGTYTSRYINTRARVRAPILVENGCILYIKRVIIYRRIQ